jgi:MoxR-like ATPase
MLSSSASSSASPRPDRLFQRHEAAEALRLAITAGEHALLVGPPGTAKSALARSVAAASGLRVFARLLTGTTVPDELFGPLRLSALKEDRYERATEGYLPTAEVAFLDEVFRAPGPVLSGLLQIMEEGTYANGDVEAPVPLASVVGATNEWPSGPEMEALTDRFLVRCHIAYVPDPLGLLGGSGEGWDAPEGAAPAERLERVRVPHAIRSAIASLAEAVRATGAPLSDRRLLGGQRLVRAAARLAGRSEATEADLLALRFAFWTRPEEAAEVDALVYEAGAPALAECRALAAEVEAAWAEATIESMEDAMPLLARIRVAEEETVRHLEKAAGGPVRQQMQALLSVVRRVKKAVLSDRLGLGS